MNLKLEIIWNLLVPIFCIQILTRFCLFDINYVFLTTCNCRNWHFGALNCVCDRYSGMAFASLSTETTSVGVKVTEGEGNLPIAVLTSAQGRYKNPLSSICSFGYIYIWILVSLPMLYIDILYTIFEWNILGFY